MKITSMLRVRNEKLLIDDTLNYLKSFSDRIIVYDDASNDSTVEKIMAFDYGNLFLIRNAHWLGNRQNEETRHRKILLEKAKEDENEWLVYLDADERFDFDIREYLNSVPLKYDGVSFRLFDSYLTPDSSQPYESGRLSNLDRKFGPEFRRILIAWRNSSGFDFLGADQREPIFSLNYRILKSDMKIRHYGKSLSVEQWENKCDYYFRYFPEPYKSKWNDRKGKSIHVFSDFGRTLFSWNEIGLHDLIDITPKTTFRSMLTRLKMSINLLFK